MPGVTVNSIDEEMDKHPIEVTARLDAREARLVGGSQPCTSGPHGGWASLPPVLSRSKAIKEPGHGDVSARTCAFARAGDVETADPVRAQPIDGLPAEVLDFSSVQLQDQAGFAELLGMPVGRERATLEGAEVQDQRAVALLDVALGARAIVCRCGLAKPIAGIDDAILGAPPAGAPATMVDAVRDGPIEGGAVGTGLPAGNDTANERDRLRCEMASRAEERGLHLRTQSSYPEL